MSSESLPSIAPLPPIQMPHASQNSSQSDLTPRQFSPAALTSSPRDDPIIQLGHSSETPPSHSSPPSSLVLPQSLRKSVSVDSFVNYRREGRKSKRPSRVHTSPDLYRPRAFGSASSASPSQVREKHVLSPERNGEAILGATTINTTTLPEDYPITDSDIERSNPLRRSGEMARQASIKGKGHSVSAISSSELPLPSPAQTQGSLQSTTSSNSSLSPRADTHSTRKAPHTQPSTRRTVNMSLGTLSPRSRSGSLMTQPLSGNRGMLIDTDLTKRNASSPIGEMVIAVVGTPGCGKSIVIRKGLKGSGLGEVSTVCAPPGFLGSTTPSSYNRRTGHVSRGENSPELPLHIIEAETATTFDPRVIWPEGLPSLDGVIICYDASNEQSFRPVESLLRGFHDLKLPLIVLACKSDLGRQIEPQRALEVLKKYDVGLVEVTKFDNIGKEKMRRSFDWLVRAIFREPRAKRGDFESGYRNPASPDVLISPPPWENLHSASPTVPGTSAYTLVQPTPGLSPLTQSPARSKPSVPMSPTRARSMSDLLSEREKSKNHERQLDLDRSGSRSIHFDSEVHANGDEESREERKSQNEKDSRPAQWATLDELLDKLIFLVVSGDDPTFVTHFLLTYRRFATPRSVLLAMQKRMRQLDNPSGDPMFACFGQMRICHLLEVWIRDFPWDFAVPTTNGALTALIKSIISKTYLLHYGSEFIQFLEKVPTLKDEETSWALKPPPQTVESDDGISDDDQQDDDDDNNDNDDDDEDDTLEHESPTASSSSPPALKGKPLSGNNPVTSRERKGSLAMTASGIVVGHTEKPSNWSYVDDPTMSPKQLIKELVRVSQEINAFDAEDIAQEITRIEASLFLEIMPRHWLQYAFKKHDSSDDTTISRFNLVSNHVADWVVSLILCHDKPRARAKQVEKFVDVAQKLRSMNNYSALRAFVAGINSAALEDDMTMGIFRAKCPDGAKTFASWDLLLQHSGSHRAYRMGLKNTKGACIPALEVHMSDLLRTHIGNPDTNAADPNKIHWGKFNLMGKFISATMQCQLQCQTTEEYKFKAKPAIMNLIFRKTLMDNEMQRSQIKPPPVETDPEDFRPMPRMTTRDSSTTQSKDAALLRKLLFW